MRFHYFTMRVKKDTSAYKCLLFYKYLRNRTDHVSVVNINTKFKQADCFHIEPRKTVEPNNKRLKGSKDGGCKSYC